MDFTRKLLLIAACSLNATLAMGVSGQDAKPDNTVAIAAVLGGFAGAGIFGYKAYRLYSRVSELRRLVAENPENLELQEEYARVSAAYNKKLAFIGASLGLGVTGAFLYKKAPEKNEQEDPKIPPFSISVAAGGAGQTSPDEVEATPRVSPVDELAPAGRMAAPDVVPSAPPVASVVDATVVGDKAVNKFPRRSSSPKPAAPLQVVTAAQPLASADARRTPAVSSALADTAHDGKKKTGRPASPKAEEPARQLASSAIDFAALSHAIMHAPAIEDRVASFLKIRESAASKDLASLLHLKELGLSATTDYPAPLLEVLLSDGFQRVRGRGHATFNIRSSNDIAARTEQEMEDLAAFARVFYAKPKGVKAIKSFAVEQCPALSEGFFDLGEVSRPDNSTPISYHLSDVSLGKGASADLVLAYDMAYLLRGVGVAGRICGQIICADSDMRQFAFPRSEEVLRNLIVYVEVLRDDSSALRKRLDYEQLDRAFNFAEIEALDKAMEAGSQSGIAPERMRAFGAACSVENMNRLDAFTERFTGRNPAAGVRALYENMNKAVAEKPTSHDLAQQGIGHIDMVRTYFLPLLQSYVDGLSESQPELGRALAENLRNSHRVVEEAAALWQQAHDGPVSEEGSGSPVLDEPEFDDASEAASGGGSSKPSAINYIINNFDMGHVAERAAKVAGGGQDAIHTLFRHMIKEKIWDESALSASDYSAPELARMKDLFYFARDLVLSEYEGIFSSSINSAGRLHLLPEWVKKARYFCMLDKAPDGGELARIVGYPEPLAQFLVSDEFRDLRAQLRSGAIPRIGSLEDIVTYPDEVISALGRVAPQLNAAYGALTSSVDGGRHEQKVKAACNPRLDLNPNASGYDQLRETFGDRDELQDFCNLARLGETLSTTSVRLVKLSEPLIAGSDRPANMALRERLLPKLELFARSVPQPSPQLLKSLSDVARAVAESWEEIKRAREREAARQREEEKKRIINNPEECLFAAQGVVSKIDDEYPHNFMNALDSGSAVFGGFLFSCYPQLGTDATANQQIIEANNRLLTGLGQCVSENLEKSRLRIQEPRLWKAKNIIEEFESSGLPGAMQAVESLRPLLDKRMCELAALTRQSTEGVSASVAAAGGASKAFQQEGSGLATSVEKAAPGAPVERVWTKAEILADPVKCGKAAEGVALRLLDINNSQPFMGLPSPDSDPSVAAYIHVYYSDSHEGKSWNISYAHPVFFAGMEGRLKEKLDRSQLSIQEPRLRRAALIIQELESSGLRSAIKDAEKLKPLLDERMRELAILTEKSSEGASVSVAAAGGASEARQQEKSGLGADIASRQEEPAAEEMVSGLKKSFADAQLVASQVKRFDVDTHTLMSFLNVGEASIANFISFYWSKDSWGRNLQEAGLGEEEIRAGMEKIRIAGSRLVSGLQRLLEKPLREEHELVVQKPRVRAMAKVIQVLQSSDEAGAHSHAERMAALLNQRMQELAVFAARKALIGDTIDLSTMTVRDIEMLVAAWGKAGVPSSGNDKDIEVNKKLFDLFQGMPFDRFASELAADKGPVDLPSYTMLSSMVRKFEALKQAFIKNRPKAAEAAVSKLDSLKRAVEKIEEDLATRIPDLNSIAALAEKLKIDQGADPCFDEVTEGEMRMLGQSCFPDLVEVLLPELLKRPGAAKFYKQINAISSVLQFFAETMPERLRIFKTSLQEGSEVDGLKIYLDQAMSKLEAFQQGLHVPRDGCPRANLALSFVYSDLLVSLKNTLEQA